MTRLSAEPHFCELPHFPIFSAHIVAFAPPPHLRYRFHGLYRIFG